MAAHNKWRVFIDRVIDHGRNCVVSSGIGLYGARGAASLVPILTGDDSRIIVSNQAFDAAWHAFDDNSATIWHDSCGNSGSGFIGWDFGAPTDVIGFSYGARGGGYWDADSIENGGLQFYDDDSAAWVQLFTIPTQTGWTDRAKRFFYDPSTRTPDDGGYRFWEIRGIANQSGGDFNGMARCEMFRASGGNIARAEYGGTTRRGGSFQAGSVDEIFQDAFVGLAQWNGPANGSQWFAWDFGEGDAKRINEITMLPNRDAVGRSWSTFEVAVWNNADRSDRIVLQEFSTTWVAATPQTFTLDSYGVAPRRRPVIVVT